MRAGAPKAGWLGTPRTRSLFSRSCCFSSLPQRFAFFCPPLALASVPLLSPARPWYLRKEDALSWDVPGRPGRCPRPWRGGGALPATTSRCEFAVFPVKRREGFHLTWAWLWAGAAEKPHLGEDSLPGSRCPRCLGPLSRDSGPLVPPQAPAGLRPRFSSVAGPSPLPHPPLEFRPLQPSQPPPSLPPTCLPLSPPAPALSPPRDSRLLCLRCFPWRRHELPALLFSVFERRGTAAPVLSLVVGMAGP